MPDVIADPEKLRNFSRVLTASAQELEQVVRRLQRGLDQTGWRDSERQKFEADFQQTLRSVSQFTERLRDQYLPTLQRKAEALERFRS